MGCTGWQALEIPETQEWETRPGNSLERSHLRLMLHWERNLLLRGSCRFLEEKQKGAKLSEGNPQKKGGKSQRDQNIYSPTLGDQAP